MNFNRRLSKISEAVIEEAEDAEDYIDESKDSQPLNNMQEESKKEKGSLPSSNMTSLKDIFNDKRQTTSADFAAKSY